LHGGPVFVGQAGNDFACLHLDHVAVDGYA
jgi:hypothetical protein